MRKPMRWITLGVALFGLAAALIRLRPAADQPVARCRLDHNAAWISVDWTSQTVDPAAVERLARQSAARHIRYLYPFTTYVKEHEFSQAYVHAAEFVRAFRKHNTETRLIAWVGVPLKRAGPYGIEGWTDLTDPVRRRFILSFVRTQLIDRAGFDGIQFNVETTFDRNAGLLIFLDEARRALGSNVILSVTGETWAPNPAAIPVGDRSWSADYYQQVARRVDQIAAMAYDSRMIEAEAYRLWLRDQGIGLSGSLTGTDAELLIGLSVSRESSEGHHPDIESMGNALIGICDGVEALAAEAHPISGAAVYAAWEATDADWAVWDRWLAGAR